MVNIYPCAQNYALMNLTFMQNLIRNEMSGQRCGSGQKLMCLPNIKTAEQGTLTSAKFMSVYDKELQQWNNNG